MNKHKMTEQEKEHRIAQIRTGLAFGGGELTKKSEQDIRDILDGKCTTDDIRQRIYDEHARRAE